MGAARRSQRAGALRNLTIMALGAVLVGGVVASTTETVRAIQLSRALDRADQLASEGEYMDAAFTVHDVLREQPLASQAVIRFVCYAWKAEEYDVTAETLQIYLTFGVTPRQFDNCTSGNPLGGALAVFPFGSKPASGGLVYVRDGVEGTAAAPTANQLLHLEEQPGVRWIGLACRNRSSGLERLGTLQVRQFEEAGGNVDLVIGLLPAAWGCSKPSNRGDG